MGGGWPRERFARVRCSHSNEVWSDQWKLAKRSLELPFSRSRRCKWAERRLARPGPPAAI